MSFSALASRIAALSGALGTAALNLSDDALRAMLSISDDFGDDLARAIAGGSDDLTRFINTNADDIARAVGNGGDDAVNGLRAIATNPAMMRTFQTFFTGMDDVLARFAASGGDDLATFVSQNFDDISARYGQSFARGLQQNAGNVQAHLARATQVIDDAVAGATSVLDDTARATLDDAARTGRPPLSWTDRWMLNRMKIGMGMTAATAGLVVAEFTSGHAISTWLAHKSLDIAEGLQDIDPALVRAFADGGLDAIMFSANLADTQRNAAINYIATMLEDEGRTDEALAVRIGGVIFNPVLYAEVALADEGQRAETFIGKLEDARIPREGLTRYLNEHPRQRAMIEERLGVDLAPSLPGLNALDPSTIPANPDVPADRRVLTEAQEGLLGKFNRMATATSSEDRFAVAQEIAGDNAFSFGNNEFLGMNFNSMLFSAFSWAAQNLGWIPGLGDAMRNMAVAQVTAAGASQFGDVPQFNTVLAQIRGTASEVVAEVTRDPSAPTLS